MFKNNMLRYTIEALVIAAVIIAVILCVKFSNFKNNDGAGVGLTVDPDSGTFVEPEIEELEKNDGGISIPGWGSINVAANETSVDVNLKNPEENENKYDLAFTITLDGEDEPIAETGLIPAGKSALKLKLTKPLEPGTYEATVLVQPYRVDDQSKTNNAEIKTVIIAE